MNAKSWLLILACCGSLIGIALLARGCGGSVATTSEANGKVRSGTSHDPSANFPQASTSQLPTKRPREPETSLTKFVREKLEAIIIPLVSFEQTSAEEAIDFLSHRVMELDPEPNAGSRGISFRIKRPRDPFVPAGAHVDTDYIGHDFEAGNISAWKLLQRIASDNGMRVEITEQGVLLTSPEADQNPLQEEE